MGKQNIGGKNSSEKFWGKARFETPNDPLISGLRLLFGHEFILLLTKTDASLITGRIKANGNAHNGIMVRRAGQLTLAEEAPLACKNASQAADPVYGAGISRKVSRKVLKKGSKKAARMRPLIGING